MATQIPKRGVKLTLDPAHRSRALSVSRSHTEHNRLSDKSQRSDLFELGDLKQRGTLQQVLRGIMARFADADRKQRDSIDQEVMKCLTIARFLAGDDPTSPKYHSGKWVKFWRKYSTDPSKALKFVFDEAHADPRKASFYFCATYLMFESNVNVVDLPALVTRAGGYQALADRGRRFPREKKVNDKSRDAQVPDRLLQDSLGSPLTNGPSLGPDDEGTRVAREEGGQHSKPMMLSATFERGGDQFTELPTGCYARVHLQIIEVAPGRRAIRIFHAVQASGIRRT